MLELIDELAPDIAFDPATISVMADAFHLAGRSVEPACRRS
jgi:hypothetical protein